MQKLHIICLISMILFLSSTSFAYIDPELVQKAKAGDIEAKARLAEIYLDPSHGEMNFKEGVKNAIDAANGGSARGQYMYGKVNDMLCSYEPSTCDYLSSIYWYTKSVDQEYLDAYADLGMKYINGDEEIRDLKKGLLLLEKSVELKSSIGLAYMGVLYMEGKIVKKDSNKYIELISMSADLGNPSAIYILGKAYLAGFIVPKNLEKAKNLLSEASSKNNKSAMRELGKIYLDNKSIYADERKGAEFIIQAADRCDLKAQEILASLYDEGIGVPKNYIKAYAWHSTVLALGTDDKTHHARLEFIADKLSNSDLIESQRLSEKHFQQCKRVSI